ncbi:hypothetical protein EDC01DRAFT_678881 [Geopyxis carbonaria]|nr:hypothetical protein EDC01DRAFT_678881 [Geopyxis carbonaria]
MFLYMVAELSALQQVISALTGLNGLPAVIVEVVVTTTYTGKLNRWTSIDSIMMFLALGGFPISFITDNIQGALIGLLVIICACAIGTSVTIDVSTIGPSGLTAPSLLGYQLIYILLIGIIFSDMFLSNFWMRAFASKTDKDLWIGCSIASFAVFVILVLISSTGFVAAWAGVWTPDMYGGLAFFLLLEQLPAWVIGLVIVMVISLSCAVFDSLQSAMVSTASNDLFRNKLPLIYVRGMIFLVTAPAIVLALKSPSILQIYLISNIFATATLPPLLLGLSSHLDFLNGFDAVCGGLGGMLSVFMFGAAYYSNAYDAAQLLILRGGLYADDWTVFGVFVAAPVGSLVFTALACAGRLVTRGMFSKVSGHRLEVVALKV